jgi:hypothetical protein
MALAEAMRKRRNAGSAPFGSFHCSQQIVEFVLMKIEISGWPGTSGSTAGNLAIEYR